MINIDKIYEEYLAKPHKLIYLHGFGSSAASGTVETLRRLLPDWSVVAPDIPVDPKEALTFLHDLCDEENPDVVVGTSMGGMYAQQMRGYKRICVNPAFEMSKTSKVLKVGTFEYYKPRMDGETHFTITPEIIQHHAEMEAHQFDDLDERDRDTVWALFGKNDTQVNCRRLFEQTMRNNNVVEFHGGHRLSEEAIEEVLVPLVRKIVASNNLDDAAIVGLAEDMRYRLGIGGTVRTLVCKHKTGNNLPMGALLGFEDDALDNAQDEEHRHLHTNVYFPWRDVLASMCIRPWRTNIKAEVCPKCGHHTLSLWFCSPTWTWRQLCGRAGNMTICPHCLKQMDFQLIVMN